MSTFLNTNLGTKTPNKFIWKHLLFSFIWLLMIIILIFRVDAQLISNFGKDWDWAISIMPILLLVIFVLVTVTQKWYYSIAIFFYPLLVFFWFLPKLILEKGKIYLFFHYVEFIFIKLTKFKTTVIKILFFSLALVLLFLSDNNWLQGLSLIITTYFYFKFVANYLKASFSPAQLFGNEIEEYLKEVVEKSNVDNRFLINEFAIQTSDEKLTIEERKPKQLKRLALMYIVLTSLSQNLNSFKGKKSYVISWVLQLSFFLLISIIYFTVLNYTIYNIDTTQFIVSDNNNWFEFFYYTLKSFTFNGIDSIKPNSILTKLIEILSYLIVGVFLLIIVASVFFSLRQDKIRDNIELTVQICNTHNEYIISHINSEYGLTLQAVFKEFEEIKKSTDNIKEIINKVF